MIDCPRKHTTKKTTAMPATIAYGNKFAISTSPLSCSIKYLSLLYHTASILALAYLGGSPMNLGSLRRWTKTVGNGILWVYCAKEAGRYAP